MACFWYDGRFIEGKTLPLSVDDPGLLYGATVFTTMRVYDQSLDHPLSNWQGHCDRLRHSLNKLGWQLPDWSRLEAGATQLLPHFPVLRITVFPDGREWMVGRDLPPDLRARQQQGITAWVAGPEWGRSLSADKTGNYLAPWLARQRAQEQGAAEAILVDPAGNWLETSTGNLWGWRDGHWWTPPLEAGLLPGLARARLIDHLHAQEIPVNREVPWSADQRLFEALAYTNSVVEVIPIHTVLQGSESHRYDPSHNGLKALRQCFSSGNPTQTYES